MTLSVLTKRNMLLSAPVEAFQITQIDAGVVGLGRGVGSFTSNKSD